MKKMTSHFLQQICPQETEKLWVTLTFAESMDTMIAGPHGEQVKISGPQSMLATHHLRKTHDAILVGIGTVLNDDPKLTVRLPDIPPLEDQPYPVVLDSQLRTPPTCQLIRRARGPDPQGKPVTIFYNESSERSEDFDTRFKQLQNSGASLVSVKTQEGKNDLSFSEIFGHLAKMGLRSVMVEGGAKVIESLIQQESLIDQLVITVGPVYLGANSVKAFPPHTDLKALQFECSCPFGRDVLYLFKKRNGGSSPASVLNSQSN